MDRQTQDEVQRLRELLEKEKDKRKEAEQAQQQAEQAQQQAEQAQQQAEQAQQQAEQAQQQAEHELRIKTSPTSLPQFLDLCHVHYHSNLNIREKSQSTRGDPANAHEKLRPNRIRPWDDFSKGQSKIWSPIVESKFIKEEHFSSRQRLEEEGIQIRRQMLGSEMDLQHFLRRTMEEPVTSVISKLHENTALRKEFRLRGSVTFENHSNTLSPDDVEEQVVQRGRRRSPRLQARASSSLGQQKTHRPMSRSRSTRPRADQICVYNTGDGKAEAAYVSELKAPHKLPLSVLYQGLGEIDLDDIVLHEENEDQKRLCQRLVAAVITQIFSYMIQGGFEYGAVCTGEAVVFLRVLEDDPETVYYHLSVPETDVGETTGWTPELHQENRLHLTAVAQFLAFTLRAIMSKARSQKWKSLAIKRLQRWRVDDEEIREEIPISEMSVSEYFPTLDNEFLRMSPIRLRSARGAQGARAGCTEQGEQTHEADGTDDDDDKEAGADTPSRSISVRGRRTVGSKQRRDDVQGGRDLERSKQRQGAQGKKRQYCTHQCLLSLKRGGELDRQCPNVDKHRSSPHPISLDVFLQLLRKQLARDLDKDCEPIGRPCTQGVPFRVSLASHGYTVVAKATPKWFLKYLQREKVVYRALEVMQGEDIPVYLGSVHLRTPYQFEGFVELTDMMLMSYGGMPVSQLGNLNCKAAATKQGKKIFHKMRSLGVLHGDKGGHNILWRDGVTMVIDFGRSKVEKRKPLVPICTNNKRKADSGSLLESLSAGKRARVGGKSAW